MLLEQIVRKLQAQVETRDATKEIPRVRYLREGRRLPNKRTITCGIELDPDVHAELKRLAHTTKTTIKAQAALYLRQGLKAVGKLQRESNAA